MPTINTTIVNIAAVVTTAPTPSGLQQSGAIISLGGTTLTTNTYEYIGQLSTLTGILSGSGNSTELTNMGTTFFAQGSAVGTGSAVGFSVLELGAVGSGDGAINTAITALQTWINTNPNTFYSYLVPANWDTIPAPVAPTLSSTSGGSLSAATYYAKVAYTNDSGLLIGFASAEASEAVLANNLLVVDSPAALTGATGWIPFVSTATGTETAQVTTPIAIGTNWTQPTSGLVTGAAIPNTLASVAANYSSPTGKTYFFVTTSLTNIVAYPATSKAVVATVPSPTAAGTEFQAAALFYQWLSNNPSAATPAAPMAFRFVYGVTPWATTGSGVSNVATINSILSAGGNVILTGAEGGISTAAIYRGTCMDVNQMMFWYAIDWLLINGKQQLAAAIINGSNTNPPLYYNQNGINQLLAVLNNLGISGIAFGLLLSASFTATSFSAYTTANPSNYAAGIYNGFACTATPQLGFQSITFYLDAVQFATGAQVTS